jgi:hypothetical protein
MQSFIDWQKKLIFDQKSEFVLSLIDYFILITYYSLSQLICEYILNSYMKRKIMFSGITESFNNSQWSAQFY